MEHGGKRPHAGRKKGSLASHTLQAQTLRQRLIERVLEEQEPIIEALLKQAKAGQVQALKEVFERVLGRVKSSFEIESTGSHIAKESDEEHKKELLKLLKMNRQS